LLPPKKRSIDVYVSNGVRGENLTFLLEDASLGNKSPKFCSRVLALKKK